jgi:Xaa-Pro aminopeptidase
MGGAGPVKGPMLQTFDDPAGSSNDNAGLARLRAALAQRGLDAFLVPRADEHQGEYVPPSAERLRWLTGFTGSAGTAVVGVKKAALFVDGRYTLQAPAQVDPKAFAIAQVPEASVDTWLLQNLGAGAVVGFDPWLHTIAAIERLEQALAAKDIKLKAVPRNLVDLAWGDDRPAPPTATVIIQPLEFAGVASADKIAALQGTLKADGQDAAVLTLPDSICWLFNIRGADVAQNPVVLAFAILPRQGKPQLFIDPAKLTPEVKAYLKPLAKLAGPEALTEAVAALKSAGGKVRLDPNWASWWLYRKLGGKARVALAADPCIGPKARKNAAEIVGARAAHVRDGAAVVQYLAWLDARKPGTVDEIQAVEKLEACRVATGKLRDLSFPTISGSGPNGAIVHYRVTRASNRKLGAGELFLIDSGGQYQDGTTDITRTVAIGKPSDEMRRHYTLVLKGHIAIGTARFPRGTRGVDLDPFARHALWAHGLDFDHGTGHGVGSYLSVHEGPQSISKRGMAVIEPGMIISNEPGYYKTGSHGIRIENLVLAEAASAVPGGDRDMLSFETLTLAPYDRRLIVLELLSPAERGWIDGYHARVSSVLGPLVGSAEREWLAGATAKL